jgi:uncharacterized protein YqhQ
MLQLRATSKEGDEKEEEDEKEKNKKKNIAISRMKKYDILFKNIITVMTVLLSSFFNLIFDIPWKFRNQDLFPSTRERLGGTNSVE